MDDYTATGDYYTSGDAATAINAGLAASEGASVPTASWADGLKDVFNSGADAITFGIKTAKDLATLGSNSQTAVSTNNSRNQAAMIESRRAIAAAEAAPLFPTGNLGGFLMPLLLIGAAVLVFRAVK